MIDQFLRNRHLLVLTILLSLAAGATSLANLPRQEDPRIATRNAFVITRFPGAPADRVETLVTEKIERRLQEVSEIKTLQSTSRNAISVITVELQAKVDETDNDAIFSRIRDKLADAQRELPAGARPPVFEDKRGPVAYTLIAAIRVDKPAELPVATRLAESLGDRLRRVFGTELVDIFGGVDEEIQVDVRPERLAEAGLSVADVAQRLYASDPKTSAGVASTESVDLSFEVAGQLDDLQEVSQVGLRPGRDGALLRVQDVATVTKGYREPPTEIAIDEGMRSVFVAARLAPGQRVDRWSPEARAEVDAFAASVEPGLDVDVVFEQGEYTVSRLKTLANNLLLGALVVLAVVTVTMGWRSGLLVGAALPLVSSIVAWLTWMRGGALHQMAIFGMIIALGLLIDNAIVVVDEVNRRFTHGASRSEALRSALRHLFSPLLASTLTTILAFAPIQLLPGSAGDFVGPIGETVSYAIAASFVLSMTVIAALAALTARQNDGGPRRWWAFGLQSKRLERGFRSALHGAIRRPWLGVPVACLPALVGFAVFPMLGRSFFPPVDRDMFDLQLTLPKTSSIERTRDVAHRIGDQLRQRDEVERVSWLVGASFPSVYYNQLMQNDGSPFFAQASVKTTSSKATERLVGDLQSGLMNDETEARVVAREFGQGPPITAGVQIRIFGPSIDRLRAIGEEVRRVLQTHPSVLQTEATIIRGSAKVTVDVPLHSATMVGVTLRDISRQLRDYLTGRVGGRVLEGLADLPVRVRLPEDDRTRLSTIGSLHIKGRAGATPLASFADLTLKPELSSITRYDAERVNTIKGYTRRGALPIEVAKEVMTALDEQGLELPPGYRFELGGAVEQDSEALGNLFASVPVLLVLIASCLVLALRSVKMAGILASVGGLAVGLAFLSTFGGGFPVSFNTFLGTLGLIGVALNDSIVVLAAINENPDARAGQADAVVDEVVGCGRHIASTTLTTIGGFLPLLLFVGGDFWPSLAIVLVGGISGATLLATIMVPATYTVLVKSRGRAA